MEGSKNGVSRRKFIGGMAAASAFAVVPRHVLGGVGFVAPSDMINIAQIGAGTQAIRQLNGGMMRRDDIRVTSVTDPNRETQDYVDWSRLGTRRSTRRLLGDDSWGEGDTGTRGGRDYVKRIIDTYYAESGESDGARTYEDYREMLAAENDADAVVIIVPDHLHAHISIAAMKAGKAVIMHKPVGLSPHEVRRVLETEKETGAVTHLLAYSAPENHGRLKSWLEIGAIGHVREVHNWTNRPVWPQAWPDYPQEQAGDSRRFQLGSMAGPHPASAVPSATDAHAVPGLVQLRGRVPRRHGQLQPVAAASFPEARRAGHGGSVHKQERHSGRRSGMPDAPSFSGRFSERQPDSFPASSPRKIAPRWTSTGIAAP